MKIDRILTGQFIRYVLAGGIAVVLDFGTYFLLLWLGVHYIAANIVGNVLGFFATFLFNKYFVFGKKDRIMRHFIRYCMLNVFNIVVQTMLLYLFVQFLHLDEGSGKVISWALTILWNFFLYKFLVYV